MTGNTGETKPTLVLGGTGKTGRRVVERLEARGLPVRVGSRSGTPRLDWEDRSTWTPVLDGVGSIYLTYYPDIAVPGARETIRSFAELAIESGVPRMALLSGRGEPEAERAEQAVWETPAELTIVRSNWFNQNFSEDYLLDHVLSGEIRVPGADAATPFVDADDIADVAVAALTDDRHIGEVYDLTGPRSITFAEATAAIGAAVGRELRYTPISLEQHEVELAAQGVEPEVIQLLNYLFSEQLLDGRNSTPADGVERALGRKPRDFADYAHDAAATGVWGRPAVAA
jgi:uncharacterized protein YbjT (DUF2867 family)